MNGIIKILIANDNNRLTKIIQTYIQKQEDMKIVGIAKNGKEAIEIIEEKKPDVAIIDIIMPYIDGLGVLEAVKQMKKEDRPICIMTSPIGNERIVQQAIELGAEYFFKKPFDLENMITLIRRFTSSNALSNVEYNLEQQYKQGVIDINKKEELEVVVTKIIHQIGIPAHVKGHSYIREAIIMRVNDISDIKETDKVTKILYPKIANKFKTKPSCVERAIRNAIEIAWDRKQQNQIRVEEIFGNTILSTKGKPTNREFIAAIVDEIKIKYKYII